MDDAVDALERRDLRELRGEHIGRPESSSDRMSLILFARSLERIADHATNICEEVMYLVKGEDIRHQGGV